MSFFSRSKSKGHYPNHEHGSRHYKKEHRSGGLLGKIMDALMGSGRHSGSYSSYKSHSSYRDTHNQRRHKRKSLWS
jgi:hypothetical protein